MMRRALRNRLIVPYDQVAETDSWGWGMHRHLKLAIESIGRPTPSTLSRCRDRFVGLGDAPYIGVGQETDEPVQACSSCRDRFVGLGDAPYEFSDRSEKLSWTVAETDSWGWGMHQIRFQRPRTSPNQRSRKLPVTHVAAGRISIRPGEWSTTSFSPSGAFPPRPDRAIHGLYKDALLGTVPESCGRGHQPPPGKASGDGRCLTATVTLSSASVTR